MVTDDRPQFRLDMSTVNGVGYVSIASLAAWLRGEALSNHVPLVAQVLAEEALLIEKAYADATK